MNACMILNFSLRELGNEINCICHAKLQVKTAFQRHRQNIGTQGVQELFFCDLKPPGGSSTQWTLKSYDKDNSFTYTGPGFPAFNVIMEFHFLVQILMIVVPKHFATILQNNTFPSFSPF